MPRQEVGGEVRCWWDAHGQALALAHEEASEGDEGVFNHGGDQEAQVLRGQEVNKAVVGRVRSTGAGRGRRLELDVQLLGVAGGTRPGRFGWPVDDLQVPCLQEPQEGMSAVS